MKTRPSRQFEVIKMIKSRVSVFFIYLYPYLRACQWTVGTWITFDRRNWQDTSFASNFGLACIWNFVAMFHIFTHIYTCMFHIFWIVQKCIDLYVYIYTIYDWFISLFFTDNTNTGEHTLIMDLNHIVNILCCRDVFRSHISEGSCRHGKNGRQGELRFLPQKNLENWQDELLVKVSIIASQAPKNFWLKAPKQQSLMFLNGYFTSIASSLHVP